MTKDQQACVLILLDAAASDLFLAIDAIEKIIVIESEIKPDERFTDLKAYHSDLCNMREGIKRKINRYQHQVG